MAIEINSIKLQRLNMTLKHPFTNSLSTVQAKPFYLVHVIGKSGACGYGETVAFDTPWYTEETVETNLHAIEDFLIPLLKAAPIHHPAEVAERFQQVKRHHMAKAALEEAIWDLFAKETAQPLFRALGGTRTEIEAGISLGVAPSIKDLLQQIEVKADAGCKRVKVKIKPGWDIEVLQAIRQAFPELPLMADANAAYTLRDLDHLRRLDAFNLMMLEQPFGTTDFVDHASLQKQLITPICLDESIHTYDDVRTAIALDSCKIINIKIGRVGGLTEAKRIHDLCVDNQMPVWCGGMLEAGIGRAHNIAIASLPGFTLPGDIGGSSYYWQEDIIEPEVIVHNGLIALREDIPGIGYALNPNAIQRYLVEEKVFPF